jgi:DNA-binding CsgD family transcriptional regulator
MPSLSLPLSLLAVAIGLIWIGAAGSAALRARTAINRRFLIFGTALLGLLSALSFLHLGEAAIDAAAAALLFANIGLTIVLTAIDLRLKATGTESPQSRASRRILGRFIALSAAFLPHYFTLLSLGALNLLRRGLDHPPLVEGDRLSDYAKSRFALTAREAEVIEYVLDGYTVKDLSGVLGMAPKTAENHLYSAYQKVGVNNRIQLFQVFQDQRSEA